MNRDKLKDAIAAALLDRGDITRADDIPDEAGTLGVLAEDGTRYFVTIEAEDE